MRDIKFAVVSTKPAGIVVIGSNTKVELEEQPVDVSKIEGVSNLVDVSYEDIGGLKEEVNRVFDVGDVLFLRVVEVDEVKKAKLGLKGREYSGYCFGRCRQQKGFL